MEAADRIVEEIERGRIPMSRLEDALSRIAYVREQIGAMHETRAFGVADPAFVDTTLTRITEEGIACIANEESILPLSPERHRRILVAGCATDEKQMEKLKPVVEELSARGFEVTFQNYLLICWQDQMDALQEKYDLIIATYHCPIVVGAFADYASSCWSAHLLDKRKSMFLNFGSPHFADDYFPEARTFVNVHSAPSADSIRAAVECLCGERPFLGTSPVVLAR
jgi:beta-N-acetylhexosaminidase